MRSHSVDQFDSSNPGSKVLNGMTIHKQYLEYNELKALMYHRIKLVNQWAFLLNLIAIITLIYIVITLFLDMTVAPLSCVLSHFIVWHGTDPGDPVYEAWTYVIAKLLGFIDTIVMMVLGTYIIYYKTIIKVDTVRQVKKKAFCSMIVFGCIGLGHAVLAILCAFTMSYESEDDEETEIENTKRNAESLISACLELIFFSA